jgi:hypothetical protein
MAAAKKKATPPVAAGYSPLYVLPGGTYDINRKYVESTDRQGHYRQVRNLKFTPAVEAMIERAVADDPAYGGSAAAFIRDAIIHRLWYIAHSNGSTIDPVLLQLQITRQEMDAAQDRDRQIREDLDKFLETVDGLCQVEGEDQADVLCVRMRDMLMRPELTNGHRKMIEEALDQADEMMSNPRARRRRS